MAGIYLYFIPLAALCSFGLVAILLVRGRGPMSAAGVILLTPLPLLVGLFAALTGAINAFKVIAFADAAVKPSEWAEGISTLLAAPLFGLLLMGPTFVIAAGGAFFRAINEPPPSAKS